MVVSRHVVDDCICFKITCSTLCRKQVSSGCLFQIIITVLWYVANLEDA